MKTKIVKILLFIFTFTLSLTVFTACGDSHSHDYSIAKSDAVNHWYECSCGEKDYLEAHSGGKASCSSKAVCKICSSSYGETLPHNYTSVVTDPTCVDQGFTTHTCTCGDVYVDNYVDALGHSYTSVVTEPTCTAMGYTTYTCACGDQYKADDVNALYHDFGDWQESPEGAIYKVCQRDSTHILYKSAVDDELAVLYSANDKKLDFPSLKRALNEQNVDISSLNDITSYIVNGESSTELSLKVTISNGVGGFVDSYGRNRTIAIPQTVTVVIRGYEYVLNNVYAYTKIIDEAEDLNYFIMNGTRSRNAIDGYFILTKNIDATNLVLNAHKFQNTDANGKPKVYPGNGYSMDVGFKGILDGQGHTINGLTLNSCGLFGQANAPVIKNIAFTNVNLTGYYPALFALHFSRGKNPDNSFNGYEGLMKNVYVSVNSTTKGSAERVGLLVNGVLPSANTLENVVVEYTNVSNEIKEFIDKGNSFYLFGASTYSTAASTDTYNNCFAISSAPILAHRTMPGFAENQVKFTLTQGQYSLVVSAVGEILDKQVTSVLNVRGLSLTVHNVLVGVRTYATRALMTADAEANAAKLATFDTKYWTVVDGIPTWNNL